jgi:NodT family efflux transporter outer membrane factor (OMF) lipoprotein
LTRAANTASQKFMKPMGFLYVVSCISTAALTLSGCAVGPNYHAPAAPVTTLTPAPLPPVARADDAAQHFVTGADISGDWWSLYHSPQLNALIDAALAHNPNLQAAQQTLLEAEENYRAGLGVLVPTITSSFQPSRTRISSAELANSGAGAAAGNVIVPPFTLYDASVSLSYSLDLFGGSRRQLEQLRAQTDYERYELEAAYLTLTANIVTAAVMEASLHGQIEATQETISAEQHDLSILQTQFSDGGIARAQVLQQQATLAQSQATLPPLQSQLAVARDQLAAYVGVFPGSFHEADFTLADLALPDNIPVSLPASIVSGRPDIQAAAAQLHEASAGVGVAIANMLPNVTISANVGQEALTIGTLFTPQNLLWTLAGDVTQPLFEGGKLDAQRKSAIAALAVSGAQYQNTVITAFQTVADTLQALAYDADTQNAADAAANAAQASLAVAQNQYRLGGEPLINVLNAQTTFQSAKLAQVKALATRLSDTAALYQALGGGWWHRADVNVSCCGIIP